MTVQVDWREERWMCYIVLGSVGYDSMIDTAMIATDLLLCFDEHHLFLLVLCCVGSFTRNRSGMYIYVCACE